MPHVKVIEVSNSTAPLCWFEFLFFSSDIVGEIGFQFDRETITINDDLQADCVVATQAGLRNPRADITWLGPDGSVYNSSQGVPFETVTRQGVEQQEARLPLSFKPFGPGDAAEYSCLATITSDDFPGSETQVFRTVEIPTRGKPRHCDYIEELLLYWSLPSVDTSTIPVPVYPSPEDNVPVAGQEYTIDCSVQSPGVPLTNDDISWSGPGGPVQGPPGRVFVDDVFQDSATGRWVRRLTFSPLSTEDSGPYTCISPQGTRVQTLTVNGEHLDSLTHYHYLPVPSHTSPNAKHHHIIRTPNRCGGPTTAN